MRFKYSILYLILSILVLISGSAFFVGYYLYQDTLRESLEYREANKANDIAYYINSMIDNMMNDIKSLSNILKNDPLLINGIIQYQLYGNVKPLKKAVENLYPNLSRMEVDLFIVADSRGNTAYRAHNPKNGDDLHRWWGLEEALAGEDILAAGYGPRGWAIRTLAPLSQDSKQYGVLILGIYLNDEFARKIAGATNTQISFSTPHMILASSWPSGERQKVGLPWVSRSLNEKRSFFHIDESSNISSFHIPMDIGDETVCLVVNTDTSPIFNLLEQKKRHLFLSFFGVLIIISGIGCGLIVSIVRPLRTLEQRALGMVQEVSGEEIPVTPWGNEIYTLSQSMDVMLAAVRTHLTDLHQAQDTLQERENFLASIFNSIQDGIVVMDRDFTILRANPSEEHIFRHHLPLVGRKCYELRHGLSHPCEECPCRQAMETGKTGYQLKKIVTGPAPGWVETFAFPLRDLATGQITGIIEYIRNVTERKRAEEALAEEAIRRRILVEQSRDGIVVLDQTGKVLEANQRYAEMLGYSAEEVRQLYVWDWDAQWSREELLEKLRRVDVAGDHFETRHRRQDGTIFNVEISTNGAVLAGQKLIFCVCRDISQRKAAERALRKSEEKYRLLVKQIPAVVFRGYPDWSIDIFDDQKIEKLTGYPKEDFDTRRRKWSDLILEDDLPQVKAIFLEGLKSAGTYEREYRIRKKSGEIIWVQVHGRIFLDTASQVDHISGVIFDVTARKRAEEELQKERDLSISIMESLPGVFYLFDEQGRLRRWNKNLEEISQYSALEILEMHPQDFFAGQDKTRIGEAIQNTFATGEVRIEAELVSKDGVKTPYLFTGRRLLMEGELYLVGMGLDISQRRQMEEALKKRLVALSRPLDDAGDINFDDLFNLENIQRIQDLFAEVTGVASLITTPEGIPITQPSNFCRLCSNIVRQTELGRKKCYASDARMGRICHDGPNVQHCLSAGLCNAGASISVGGKHIANWMIGQVRDGTENEESLRDYARSLGVDEEEFIAAYLEVPVMPQGQFKQIAQALFVLANQLSAMAYQNVQQARFITERQRAEEDLKESEKRFRDIADNALEWIWEFDAEGRFVYSSATVEKLLGYTPEEIMNKCFYDFFHPEDKEELQKVALEHFFSKIPPREFIHRVIHKNGQTVWLSTNGVILLDDQGNLKGCRGAHTDITERLQAEKALKDSERFLVSIFASIQDYITILDRDLNIVRVNPARERSNAPEMPMVGKKCYEVLYGTLLPCEDCPTLRTLATGQPAQKIVPLYLPDREGLRHINLSTFPLIDESTGQVTGVVEVGRDITEQRQAEEAIRERESMLSLVINAVPQFIFWKDLNSVYLGCNRNYARAAGLETPAAVVGRTEYDLPWGRKEIEAYLGEDREVMQSRQAISHQVETRQLADGRQIWVDGTKLPLLANDGTVMGVLGVFDDVTARKRMEEELQESETSYRTLAQNLPGLVYRVFIRENFRMEFYNDALQSMTGYTVQELGHMEFCSLDPYVMPEDREKMNQAVKQAISMDQVFEVEYRFRHKDGSIRYFAERGKPIPGEDAKISHIDGVIWDITEAKQLEAAMQESERRFRGLVENVPMGIMIVQDEEIVYQNPEQARLFGHLQIQNGHDLAICAHPEDLAKARHFWYGIMTYQPQADITLRFLPLGSAPQKMKLIWVNCRAAVTAYRGQKAMLINMVDITHTKELERLMLIREKMASLGQVAAGIAHEIRNPLSGINVFLDGIKENFQEPENAEVVRELIAAAQDTSNRIEAVIRRVLDFSRPTELNMAPTDVNLAVDNAIKLTATSLRKGNIRIDGQMAADLPLVQADFQLLEQALVNMVTNAAEALRRTGEPGRIQRSDGSGIGLSLCQRIIADHGGTIEVSTSELGGTQFIIHLPKK
jgi:PAS domain S-box-containing protein